MGSVQFQIVPCSSLYFFSRYIGPFQCLVNVNYRVLICCTCHFQSVPSSFLILASSVCKSLKCLISALKQGGERGRLFTLTCSIALWGGRKEHCKQISLACVGSARSVWTTLHLPQLTASCASRVDTAQPPGCSAGVLSKAGPAFHALSRSQLLRFRFLGTLQGHRFGWTCILCPS